MSLSLPQTLCLAWVGIALLADLLVAMAIFRSVNGQTATIHLAQAIVPGYIEHVYLRSCRESGATPSKLVTVRRITTANVFLAMVVAIPVLLMPPPEPQAPVRPAPAALDHPVAPPASPPSLRPYPAHETSKG
jgi:hypothetical protein